MEELHNDLTMVLDLFYEGELTYSDLGEWLSSNGWEIAQVLESNCCKK